MTQVIEQQLTGIDNLLYFSSASNSNGTTTITLSFATGTDPDIAQVQVQNKVTPGPAASAGPGHATGGGRGQGPAPDIMMFLALQSSSPTIDGNRLNDIIASQIQPVIGRISGVGNTTLLGSGICRPHLAGSGQIAGATGFRPHRS